jgi:phage N-6-adenine-methyltransferase
MSEDALRWERVQLAFAGWIDDDPESDRELTTDDWYTPPELVQAIRDFFGGDIDLDPCAAALAFVGARISYFREDDGLSRTWIGEVDGVPIRSRYLNPPYSKPAPWLARASELHRLADAGESIALIKADTSTRWFVHAWEAPALMFFAKRIPYVNPAKATRQVAMFPSALVYWGPDPERFREFFGFLGHVVVRQPVETLESIMGELLSAGLVEIDPDSDPSNPRFRPTETDAPQPRTHERSAGHTLLAIDGIPAETYPFLPTDGAVDPDAITAVLEVDDSAICCCGEHDQSPTCCPVHRRGGSDGAP